MPNLESLTSSHPYPIPVGTKLHSCLGKRRKRSGWIQELCRDRFQDLVTDEVLEGRGKNLR